MLAIEAIKEKLNEVRQEELEQILKVSGSNAIYKNDYNITIVDETKTASSLIFKKLTKDKIDNEELEKAIDINITELKPNIPTSQTARVDLSTYNAALDTIEDLRKRVTELERVITLLNSTISDLNSQIFTLTNEKLSIEQINDGLINQLNTLTQTIQEFGTQISTAVQKSVEESILRTSLQAQNSGFKAQIEALIKQIDSLNSIIEGLQAQLGAVQQQQAIEQSTQAQALEADASVINDVVIAKFIRKLSTANEFEMYAKIKENRLGKEPDSKWINGEGILFVNNDKAPVKVKIDATYPENGRLRWFSISQTDFEIPANSKGVEVKLELNPRAADGYQSKPQFLGYGASQNYEGEIRVTVTRADGTNKTKTYKSLLIKSHPKAYDSND